MNLLLTNDDGFSARGINVLKKRLELEHNVFILAPDSNRSAVSNHISLYENHRIIKRDDKIWSCSGYPADCSAIGLKTDLFGVKIDAVISGINHGPNLGTDIVYSGTCGASKTSVIYGIPSIAVSLGYDFEHCPVENANFEALADFIGKNLEKLLNLSRTTAPRTFVNVNATSSKSYKGVKAGNELCVRDYYDFLGLKNGEEDLESFVDVKKSYTKTFENKNSDYYLCHQNYITVSKIYVQPDTEFLNVDDCDFSL